MTPAPLRCPACDSSEFEERFRPRPREEANDFRPSSVDYGNPPGLVVRCTACGHAVAANIDPEHLTIVYEGVEDPGGFGEEAGEVATAERDLQRIEEIIPRGRLLDIGSWTGSFLVAAGERGWDATGIEPSRWATERARTRGAVVVQGTFPDARLEGPYDLVAMRDVIEHLPDPAGAVRQVKELLRPGGGIFLALPDSGSPIARALGVRWWSVMPMHLQYFTRASMRSLLERNGFDVRSVRTHTKLFSAEYCGERLAAFSKPLGKPLVRMLHRTNIGRKVVGPNLGDRMAVIATMRAR